MREILFAKIKTCKNSILRVLGLLRVCSLTLVLTERCNLRCKMCDIWEKSDGVKQELPERVIADITAMKWFRGINSVTLTGGEPFLRDDLSDIVERFYSASPRINISISSNGTLTEPILQFLARQKSSRRITLEISINGINVLDAIAQTKDTFKRMHATVSKVRECFPRVRLRAKFVITPWNYFEIESVGEYCRSHELPLCIKMIDNVYSYTNSLRYQENIQGRAFVLTTEQKNIISQSLNRVKDLSVVDQNMVYWMIAFLRKRKITKQCFVPWCMRFVTAQGEVYGCRKSASLGNINVLSGDSAVLLERRNFSSIVSSIHCRECMSMFRFIF